MRSSVARGRRRVPSDDMTGAAVGEKMAPKYPVWRNQIPSRWAELGRAVLLARGIDQDHYRNKLVKERLMDAMAVPHILDLLDGARSLDGMNEEAVVNRLVLHRATPNRWLNDEVQPHAR